MVTGTQIDGREGLVTGNFGQGRKQFCFRTYGIDVTHLVDLSFLIVFFNN